jgi:hypothetical protein
MSEYWLPLAGGALIGLAATMLMLFNGRVAGISGITEGVLNFKSDESHWQIAFLLGLVAAGLALFRVMPDAFTLGIERDLWVIVLGGLTVGFGTRLGSGCTSGHGVCGLSRFSSRSLVATLVFMGVAIVTVALTHQTLGAGQ